MTGQGALSGTKKNERTNYLGCVLMAEAEWLVKLQLRDRFACSGYVRDGGTGPAASVLAGPIF